MSSLQAPLVVRPDSNPLNSDSFRPPLSEQTLDGLMVPCPYRRMLRVGARVYCASWFAVFVSLLGVGGAVSVYLWAERTAMQDDSGKKQTLIRLNGVVFGLGLVVQCLAAFAFKFALSRDGRSGALIKLGLDSVRITALAKRSLDRSVIVLCVPACVFVFGGLYYLVMIPWTDDALTQAWYFFVGLYSLSGGPPICLALLTMFVAGALANQPILELTQRITETSPSDPAWTEIEFEAVRLANEIMPAVSQGWGWITAVFIATYWIFGFSEFIWWLKEDTMYHAIVTISSFIFSLSVLWPLAVTSSNCDRLMVSLNINRLSHISNPNAHAKIFGVETALRRLNLDQGLGFSIGGVVVDKRKLKQIFIALVSTMSPIFATVMALRPDADQTFACLLDNDQGRALQSMVSTFNASCVFNVTIGPSGIVQW